VPQKEHKNSSSSLIVSPTQPKQKKNEYLSDFVTLVSDTNTRTSRAHKLKFRIPRVGLGAPENSFIVKSSRLWNNLPDKLCLISNIDCFKSSLKNMYLECYKEAC